MRGLTRSDSVPDFSDMPQDKEPRAPSVQDDAEGNAQPDSSDTISSASLYSVRKSGEDEEDTFGDNENGAGQPKGPEDDA